MQILQNKYNKYKLCWGFTVYKLGGHPFKVYMTLIGLVSSLGLFNVQLCTSSRVLYAFANDAELLGKK